MAVSFSVAISDNCLLNTNAYAPDFARITAVAPAGKNKAAAHQVGQSWSGNAGQVTLEKRQTLWQPQQNTNRAKL
ncbi:MAG: hypothetical protein CMI08_13355 [Oceanospirillaceae bacterium]|nr:hypothetical protein [Oceanospirillaceae bacterium]MBL33927.1 hypothetical protein [Oceanospirillaceae bacterium]MBS54272.1 hypothetical protein [Oceanospirillaceae bacterium]